MKIISTLLTTYTGLTLYDPGDFKDISTIMGTTSTVLSTLGNPDTNDFIGDADRYVQSLSEEQLVELEGKINVRDMELSFEDDSPKVRVKNYQNRSI